MRESGVYLIQRLPLGLGEVLGLIVCLGPLLHDLKESHREVTAMSPRGHPDVTVMSPSCHRDVTVMSPSCHRHVKSRVKSDVAKESLTFRGRVGRETKELFVFQNVDLSLSLSSYIWHRAPQLNPVKLLVISSPVKAGCGPVCGPQTPGWVETGGLDPDPQQAVCSEVHLVDALHPAFLQVHLGAQEVGVLAVVPRHLKVHVHAVGGTGGRH